MTDFYHNSPHLDLDIQSTKVFQNQY